MKSRSTGSEYSLNASVKAFVKISYLLAAEEGKETYFLSELSLLHKIPSYPEMAGLDLFRSRKWLFQVLLTPHPCKCTCQFHPSTIIMELPENS